jgi:hypothetical protein
VLLALHHLFGTRLAMETTFGSQNLVGTGARAAEIATSLVDVAAVVGVWLVFARGEATRERLATSAAGATAALLAFAKVFSPQFLVWLVPLVPLVRGRRGIASGALLAGALLLTRAYFPDHYWPLALAFRSRESWLLLARDAVVVALALVLAWPRGSERVAVGRDRARVEALGRIRPQE